MMRGYEYESVVTLIPNDGEYPLSASLNSHIAALYTLRAASESAALTRFLYGSRLSTTW